MSLLAVEHVGKRYGSGPHQRVALRDVSFELESGELVAVWGRRRSGRSTLLQVAAGVETPDTGVVRYEGRPLSDRGTRALDAVCYCRTSFRPVEGRLVLDHLVLGQLSRGVSASLGRERASDALKRAGVEHCAALKPNELDGAERVRVAIARVLVRRPRLLVIDEPTIGIDLAARDGVLLLLRSLADEGIAILTSTADASGIAGVDRALTLTDGELNGAAFAEHAEVLPFRRASGQ